MHNEDEVIEKDEQGRFNEEKNGLLSKETFTHFFIKSQNFCELMFSGVKWNALLNSCVSTKL